MQCSSVILVGMLFSCPAHDTLAKNYLVMEPLEATIQCYSQESSPLYPPPTATVQLISTVYNLSCELKRIQAVCSNLQRRLRPKRCKKRVLLHPEGIVQLQRALLRSISQPTELPQSPTKEPLHRTVRAAQLVTEPPVGRREEKF